MKKTKTTKLPKTIKNSHTKTLYESRVLMSKGYVMTWEEFEEDEKNKE